MKTGILSTFKKFFIKISQNSKPKTYIPSYRLINVTENQENDYLITIQVINSSIVFQASPEDILADDKKVEQFSPLDIRAITYLGYLGINGPKYKILAKRLAGNEKIVFALKKKGENTLIIKTAQEIFSKNEIISRLNHEDIKTISHAFATEDMQDENKLKNLANNFNNEVL